MNKLVRLIFYFCLFALGLVGILYCPLLKNQVPFLGPIEYLDIVLDLYMLLILFVFYFFSFSILSKNGEKKIMKSQKYLLIVLIACTFLISFGYGLHFAANGLETWAIGTEVSTWVFLLDEPISHFLIFFGMYILSSFLTLFQIDRPFKKRLSKQELYFLIPSSIIIWIISSAALIEGGFGELNIILTILIFTFTTYLISKKNFSIINRPWIIYYLIGNIVSILFYAIYAIIFGGFPQPTMIGLLPG